MTWVPACTGGGSCGGDELVHESARVRRGRSGPAAPRSRGCPGWPPGRPQTRRGSPRARPAPARAQNPVRAVAGGSLRARQRGPEARDQLRVVRAARHQVHQARQGQEAHRIQRQDLPVQRARRFVFAAILVQVGEVQHRRQVRRVQPQRGVQLRSPPPAPAASASVRMTARLRWTSSGRATPWFEGLTVGGERLLGAALQALHDPQVVPAVRQRRPARQDLRVGLLGIGQASGLLQRLGLANLRFGRAIHVHVPEKRLAAGATGAAAAAQRVAAQAGGPCADAPATARR